MRALGLVFAAFLFTLFVHPVSTMGTSTPTSAASAYNSIVSFSEAWLPFADFQIRYVGEREVTPQGRRMVFKQFDVMSKDGQMQRVEWSTGTGDISPATFSVGEDTFYLELSRTMLPRDASDSSGMGQALGDWQLVILTKARFKALKQAIYAR